MDAKTQIGMVDELTDNISEMLGRLTQQGVISVEDSIKIIQTINDKQCEWMKNKFTQAEIHEFMMEQYM